MKQPDYQFCSLYRSKEKTLANSLFREACVIQAKMFHNRSKENLVKRLSTQMHFLKGWFLLMRLYRNRNPKEVIFGNTAKQRYSVSRSYQTFVHTKLFNIFFNNHKLEIELMNNFYDIFYRLV